MPVFKTGLGFFAILGLAMPLFGQWLEFTDETETRLVLSTVGLDDPEEKDIAVADFDMDGDMDVIVVRKVPFSVQGARRDVLLMNENGVLTDRTDLFAPGFGVKPTDARDVMTADFTGDGWPDVIIANTFAEQPVFYRNRGEDKGGVWLGLIEESGTRFPNLIPVNQAGGPQFCAACFGDIDGDNDQDVYFSNYNMSGGTADALLINNGTGFFSDGTAANMGTFANVAFGTNCEFHDVDNDGDRDLIKISTLYGVEPYNSNGIFILYNNGAGVFNTVPFTELPVTQPYMFTAGQLDDDPLLEFYGVADSIDQVVHVTAAVPDGPVPLTGNDVLTPRTGGFGGNVKLADLDGDGDMDVGLAPIDVDIQNCDDPTARFALLRNDGSGNLIEPWPINDHRNFHIRAHDFAFMDINGDECPDILMGLCVGWAVMIQANCGVDPCPADCAPDNGDGTFGDGTVDGQDLMAGMAAWGGLGGLCDIWPLNLDGSTGDGKVTVSDIIRVIESLGPCK